MPSLVCNPMIHCIFFSFDILHFYVLLVPSEDFMHEDLILAHFVAKKGE